MSIFMGSGVALVTPFTDTGIALEKLEELIEMHIEQSTDAIIICGTTGEASTMTEDELKTAIKFTVERVKNRIPVIAGTGTNDTAKTIRRSLYAQEVGADGLLVITPYYNKTSQKGLVEHFTAVADAVDLPIIIYNVPSRTGLNMLPKTLETLSHHKNIAAVKEASGNISQIAEIAYLCGDRLDIYSGNDDQVVPILSLGGKGVISVVANIAPKEMHDMVDLYHQGRVKESKDMQLKIKPLNDAVFLEVNPIPIKTAMNLLGYNVGKLRLPLTSMSGENLDKLMKALTEYGFTVKENGHTSSSMAPCPGVGRISPIRENDIC
ncbi:MAG: 4-hydroxy-tetrahydrodipicolinate synthase [Firmicutes bacterium]|nr:4-hydroxy-tetrahydrodipicolinate synthase [Bacillota bacterium]MDI6706952.1 4-hydroxy-tetrahydrodipicolinate synthase [Bacillota bacterium]